MIESSFNTSQENKYGTNQDPQRTGNISKRTAVINLKDLVSARIQKREAPLSAINPIKNTQLPNKATSNLAEPNLSKTLDSSNIKKAEFNNWVKEHLIPSKHPQNQPQPQSIQIVSRKPSVPDNK